MVNAEMKSCELTELNGLFLQHALSINMERKVVKISQLIVA
jgi:hypothetical protein